ncbi:MAG: hypothetical protein V1872_07915 [bacterium]
MENYIRNKIKLHNYKNLIAKHEEINQLLDKISKPDRIKVKIYIKNLLDKRIKGKSKEINKDVSLYGIARGSNVTEEDLEEAKKIWR